jgi:hypothetical protein
MSEKPKENWEKMLDEEMLNFHLRSCIIGDRNSNEFCFRQKGLIKEFIRSLLEQEREKYEKELSEIKERLNEAEDIIEDNNCI